MTMLWLRRSSLTRKVNQGSLRSRRLWFKRKASQAKVHSPVLLNDKNKSKEKRTTELEEIPFKLVEVIESREGFEEYRDLAATGQREQAKTTLEVKVHSSAPKSPLNDKNKREEKRTTEIEEIPFKLVEVIESREGFEEYREIAAKVQREQAKTTPTSSGSNGSPDDIEVLRQEVGALDVVGVSPNVSTSATSKSDLLESKSTQPTEPVNAATSPTAAVAIKRASTQNLHNPVHVEDLNGWGSQIRRASTTVKPTENQMSALQVKKPKRKTTVETADASLIDSQLSLISATFEQRVDEPDGGDHTDQLRSFHNSKQSFKLGYVLSQTLLLQKSGLRMSPSEESGLKPDKEVDVDEQVPYFVQAFVNIRKAIVDTSDRFVQAKGAQKTKDVDLDALQQGYFKGIETYLKREAERNPDSTSRSVEATKSWLRNLEDQIRKTVDPNQETIMGIKWKDWSWLAKDDAGEALCPGTTAIEAALNKGSTTFNREPGISGGKKVRSVKIKHSRPRTSGKTNQGSRSKRKSYPQEPEPNVAHSQLSGATNREEAGEQSAAALSVSDAKSPVLVNASLDTLKRSSEENNSLSGWKTSSVEPLSSSEAESSALINHSLDTLKRSTEATRSLFGWKTSNVAPLSEPEPIGNALVNPSLDTLRRPPEATRSSFGWKTSTNGGLPDATLPSESTPNQSNSLVQPFNWSSWIPEKPLSEENEEKEEKDVKDADLPSMDIPWSKGRRIVVKPPPALKQMSLSQTLTGTQKKRGSAIDKPPRHGQHAPSRFVKSESKRLDSSKPTPTSSFWDGNLPKALLRKCFPVNAAELAEPQVFESLHSSRFEKFYDAEKDASSEVTGSGEDDDQNSAYSSDEETELASIFLNFFLAREPTDETEEDESDASSENTWNSESLLQSIAPIHESRLVTK